MSKKGIAAGIELAQKMEASRVKAEKERHQRNTEWANYHEKKRLAEIAWAGLIACHMKDIAAVAWAEAEAMHAENERRRPVE